MKTGLKSFRLKLRNAVVIINLKDADELYSCLTKCFFAASDLENLPGLGTKTIENIFISTSENDGVYCCQSMFENSYFAEPNEVMDWVLNTVGEYIITTLPEDEMIMHASAVCMNDKTMLLAGDSGSGKTTLSLILARNGCRYAGDEYVYVKYGQGRACGENYPIHIKNGNPLLEEYDPELLTGTFNAKSGRMGYALDRDLFDKAEMETMREIGAIVYPLYLAGTETAALRQLSIHEFPKKVLSSLIGHDEKSGILKKFAGMVSTNSIPVMELIYSDSEEARNLLFSIM